MTSVERSGSLLGRYSGTDRLSIDIVTVGFIVMYSKVSRTGFTNAGEFGKY